MKKNVRRGILIALVFCLLLPAILPPPPAEAAMTMIPVMDFMNNINMVLAWAQRLMAYVTQVLQYYNRVQKYRSMVQEWTGIGLGKYGFSARGAWLVTDFFGCNWSNQYTHAINADPGSPDAADAYMLGVVKALVPGCGDTFTSENARALDRLRRKIENATIDAIHTAGVSKSDARHIDEQIGPLMSRATSNTSTENTTTAIAQKLFATHALNLALLRNIQRQQDALIQLYAARAAAKREAQVATLNDERRRQDYWNQYAAEVGAR
jgi:conjugal transfer/entry exclusion protein